MSTIDPKTSRVIAVGNFDGVHLGHVKVLKAAAESANNKNEKAAAMTFEPHPKDYFCGEGTVKKITDEKTKTQLILETGITEHIIEKFDSELANMSSDEFVLMLKNKYNCTEIVCGSNFRFGKKAAYSTEELKFSCEKFGLKTTVCVYEEGFSSTKIREFLTDGDVETAAKLLGRNYSIRGTVLHGRHIGTEIGFPTVNLTSEKDLILPRFGVYETKVIFGESVFQGITNVGLAPTVSDDSTNIRTETFILNTNIDLYEKEITVEFIKFIRPEKKFRSLEELKNQIKSDIEQIGK